MATRDHLTEVEVLRSQRDTGGYDLVMSRCKVTRHIRFKSVGVDGKAMRTRVSLKLLAKPSGCVVWIVVTPALEMKAFLWFGGPPEEPLPNITDLAVTKHTKGNAEGVKAARLGHRVVPRGRFEQLATLDAVLERLFGPLPAERAGAIGRYSAGRFCCVSHVKAPWLGSASGTAPG